MSKVELVRLHRKTTTLIPGDVGQSIKGQLMRWSHIGAHCLVQVRAALLNRELDELAQRRPTWIGKRRVSWTSQQSSHPF